MAGIYIHIPFCYSRCSYCDFYKTTDQTLKSDFLEAICDEIILNASFFKDNQISTLYFGGGTPSVLSLQELQSIFNCLSDFVNLSELDEITMEVNPDDVSEAYIQGLIELGVNRLSMGIQSFFDAHLRKMNRRHNAKQAINAVEIAKKSGINNISIDLIYGLPYMTFDEWKKNVKMALDLKVEHISAYHLTIEKGTPYYDLLKKGKLTEINEEDSEQQFEYLVSKLEEAGFSNYEISNFAYGKLISQHNSNYWTGKKYLGLGPSAHSFDGKKRKWNISHLSKYNEQLKGKQKYWDEELLSDTDIYNERIMLGLRTLKGFNSDFIKRVNNDIKSFFEQELVQQIKLGNIEKDDVYYRVPKSKRFITDRIISDFFYIDE
ncbi:radical SAM family heme chaperone HemW [Carboxylicivirga sp. N1Y90]|uniref:radical SAM family heme chaperone HemW n=1 Tax=Carboxylicivirga fragile TaxID=3417571 RepID=UPI003D34019B|nr:radical SAM family heme chaperone HemW [Marinilabiliaceae bacterium N1Y90]